MKIKMFNADWESMIVVLNGVPASKQTLSHIAHSEQITHHVISALEHFLKEKEKLLEKKDRYLANFQAEFDKILAENGGKPDSAKMNVFRTQTQLTMDREVLNPLQKLDKQETQLDIPDNQVKSLKEIFSKFAFFGEGGYTDSPSGKSAYGRTLRALGIDPSEVADSPAMTSQLPPDFTLPAEVENAKLKEQEEPKVESQPTV